MECYPQINGVTVNHNGNFTVYKSINNQLCEGDFFFSETKLIGCCYT